MYAIFSCRGQKSCYLCASLYGFTQYSAHLLPLPPAPIIGSITQQAGALYLYTLLRKSIKAHKTSQNDTISFRPLQGLPFFFASNNLRAQGGGLRPKVKKKPSPVYIKLLICISTENLLPLRRRLNDRFYQPLAISH